MIHRVKELRARTGAGIVDCRDALQEADGDIDRAVELLRIKGHQDNQRRSKRETNEGIVHSYIHLGDRIGVLIELNCETDFVARTKEFKKLAHDLAMHIAAAAPQYIEVEDIPKDVIAAEQEIQLAKLVNGNPKHHDKILNGRMQRFKENLALMEQQYVKDDSKIVREVLEEAKIRFEENIRVRRFSRFTVGV